MNKFNFICFFTLIVMVNVCWGMQAGKSESKLEILKQRQKILAKEEVKFKQVTKNQPHGQNSKASSSKLKEEDDKPSSSRFTGELAELFGLDEDQIEDELPIRKSKPQLQVMRRRMPEKEHQQTSVNKQPDQLPKTRVSKKTDDVLCPCDCTKLEWAGIGAGVGAGVVAGGIVGLLTGQKLGSRRGGK